MPAPSKPLAGNRPNAPMHHRSPAVARALAVARVKRKLLQDSFPRLQMTLIVALTGGFGLLASFTMLRLGLDSMALRYPLALGVAYLFFLFLVWLWVRTNGEDYLDLPDLSGMLPRRPGADGLPDFKSGGGGDFGGGGASGSFDGPTGLSVDDGLGAPLESAADSVGSVADGADEFAIPLVALAIAVGLALASLYVVYIAPALFAEVLVDAALSYALFRHLRGQDPHHWLTSAFRHTVLPFIATAVFLAATGAAMSAYAPGASSVGQVVKHAGAKRAMRRRKARMKKSTPAQSPDAYIASLSGWQGRYAEALRSAVNEAAQLEERVKWGHLVYFSNGPVLLVRAEEKRVLFGFWRGKRLRGIEPRLKPGGKYELATLELVEGTSLERSTVVALVKEAVALNATVGDPTRMTA